MIKILLVLALVCCSVLGLHMETRKYYINSNVENYIEGGKQGQINYLNFFTSGNAVKCPFHKPFTRDGLFCFQCPIETPIFNFETLRCEICPTGVKGLKNHQCE